MNIFIQIVDNTERPSSLLVGKDGLQVIGVLPHCSIIRPKTKEDAIKLIDFLTENYLKDCKCRGIFHEEDCPKRVK